MKLVIFQPDIPQNTGAMVRTCACFDTDIEIIHPCSFPLNDKLLKRSAMDYGSSIKITEHDSWDTFKKTLNPKKRIILLSTKGKIAHTDFTFQKDRSSNDHFNRDKFTPCQSISNSPINFADRLKKYRSVLPNVCQHLPF